MRFDQGANLSRHALCRSSCSTNRIGTFVKRIAARSRQIKKITNGHVEDRSTCIQFKSKYVVQCIKNAKHLALNEHVGGLSLGH